MKKKKKKQQIFRNGLLSMYVEEKQKMKWKVKALHWFQKNIMYWYKHV
jgi:hypothetical protein